MIVLEEQLRVKLREITKTAKTAMTCSNVIIAGIEDEVREAYEILQEIEDYYRQREIDGLMDKVYNKPNLKFAV
jgi:hypothetical protein